MHGQDTPKSRRRIIINEVGAYDVWLWARQTLEDVVSVQMIPADQPDVSIFFRGRQGWMRNAVTHETIMKNGRPKNFPRDLLGRERLAWRRGSGGSLDLIAPGTILRSSHNPAIITVKSASALSVTAAESLVLHAAPTDPDIVGPTYTIVPLFEMPHDQ